MGIEEHTLINEALSILKDIPPRESSQVLMENEPEVSPVFKQWPKKHQHAYSTFVYCERVVYASMRLSQVITMTLRNLHRKKGEKLHIIQNAWAAYNYDFYTMIYQSVLDISFLLVNAVLDLGIEERMCTENFILNNKWVKDTDVYKVLIEIKGISKNHREGKNLLLHRGRPIPMPIKTSFPFDEKTISTLAKERNRSTDYVRNLLDDFLAERDLLQLTQLMRKECTELETQVGLLFDVLLPMFLKRQSFYSKG